MDNKAKFRLKALDEYVKTKSLGEQSGHDYWHAKRVVSTAIKLAKDYKSINYEVLIASCFIHDVYEKNKTLKVLRKIGFSNENITKIIDIAVQFRHIGKGSKKNFKKSTESEIFLDADNLDALGSIGIARAVSFGLSKGFPLFKSKKDSLNDSVYGTVKELTTWKKAMFTKKARIIAKKRIGIMGQFLKNLEGEFETNL